MSEAKQTPLVDLLKNVPKDAVMLYEHSPTHHQNIPFGRLCAEALSEIERYRAALEYYAAIEKQYAIGPRVATDALAHTAAMNAFTNTKNKYGSAMSELSDTDPPAEGREK